MCSNHAGCTIERADQPVGFFMYTFFMSELKQIIGDYTTFLNDILSRVSEEGFDFADFVQVDHMCYRTTSLKITIKRKPS